MSKSVSIPTYSEVLKDPRYADVAALFRELNQQWKPNPAQAEMGAAVFAYGKKKIGAEWGRKAGKTESVLDIITRLGNMIRGGQIYYFAAEQTAVREIIWESNRLRDWCPKDRIASINETQMRLEYKTGTFVKCDGADRFRSKKGFNPDVVVCDEAADYPDSFWNAMRPNFISKNCLVLVISSPPWELETEPGKPVYFIRMMDLWKKYEEDAAKQGKPSPYFYRCYPTSVNAANLPEGYLEAEIAELIAMGEEDVVEREYYARRVVSGGHRLVGTFKKESHVYPHDWIIKEKIEKNRNILQWHEIVDPSQELFGALWLAINPYSKEVYFLDEIAERDENETTESQLWPRIQEKEDELYPDDEDTERWSRTCDEAAKWWIVGCANDVGIGIAYNPTEKATNSLEYGISLLRVIFRCNVGYVSDRCVWFIHQLLNWRRNERGQIPKEGKDLIDCARYGLHDAGYYISKDEQPRLEKKHPRQVHAELARDHPLAYVDRQMYKDFTRTELDVFDNVGGDDDSWYH